MYDTIIVGAGSAGCVATYRLSQDESRKVLVLEAGQDAPLASNIPSDWVTMFNTRADWGYYTEPQAGCRGRRVFWPRGKMVGGSGALNAMIYIRGLASDYDAWEQAGCAGWGWRDVLPVFLSSEDNADFSDNPWHGTGGPLHVGHAPYVDEHEYQWLEAAAAAGYARTPDFNGPRQEGVGLFQFTIKNGERWSAGNAYLRPALLRPNVTLTKGVLVTGLIVENGRATGVKYLVNGVPETAYASSEVVMAAGAIGTCHILMLSGIGSADELRQIGISPRHDLPGVGKSLQDHLNIPVSFYSKKPMGIGAWTEEIMNESMKEWQDRRSGMRTSPWVAAGAHVCSREGIEPDLQLYGAITPHRDYARFLGGRSGITAHCVLQRPKSRGEIRLRSADPTEHPAIDPRYFVSDETGTDLTTLVEGVRINRRILSQAPIRDLIDYELSPSAECRTDEEIADYVRGHMATLYHPSSTCRMGTDPLAVTDPDTMKVHGLEGLRIADASAIPIMVSGNLNAPTIMVAERTCQKILAA
ncbi:MULTISPECIES: GMC family oxidoreductase N-terminal domain-containing protein [Agrobacterium]|uniref:Choline dehydrogenase n=1 Tax=Agrobacterium larrymoorei TaxID=160699 RepID=A0ABU0UD82_9HYPH|nr:GMC family oxidoreductase N-terminal domain-containing protein [Agrobacterium larrymoorei]MDQ1182896.1 choline dehydrogenase [Agrobacterium larrymoorei]MDQ1196198.1 choline dehydrogenase [Rhizobium sp. SORGH_AS_0787]